MWNLNISFGGELHQQLLFVEAPQEKHPFQSTRTVYVLQIRMYTRPDCVLSNSYFSCLKGLSHTAAAVCGGGRYRLRLFPGGLSGGTADRLEQFSSRRTRTMCRLVVGRWSNWNHHFQGWNALSAGFLESVDMTVRDSNDVLWVQVAPQNKDPNSLVISKL